MKKLRILIPIAAVMMLLVCTGCEDGMTTEIRVTPDTIKDAIKEVKPGTTVYLEGGEYAPIEIGKECSGTKKEPVVFTAAEGEKVVFQGASSVEGEDDKPTIHLVNVDNFTLDGVEVVGGTHGIYYESTAEQGETPLKNITISNCNVHDVRGVHGIAAYAKNDLAPVENLTMDGCTVYGCKLDSSESTVFNGNIDGFTICNNVIHDNNNIGIDMIGFEGKALHTDAKFDNPYDVDYVRHGVCHNNVIYNISAEGNPAYFYDGEYDLCADGIYVDGGQSIEIYDNFVFNCDIGLEVATEHSPDDNELFKVSEIKVHDNVVAGCQGWCGLCFGGYDKDLGYTEYCRFYNNTFVGNDTQIGIQRSRENMIYDNLLVGSDCTIEYNTDCREEDLNNNTIKNNTMLGADDDASEVIDGFRSLIDGVGSGFVPADKYVKIYNSQMK